MGQIASVMGHISAKTPIKTKQLSMRMVFALHLPKMDGKQEVFMPTRSKEVMSKKLVTIPMGASISTAMDLMKEKRIRHLPVVDELDDIIGILSQRDFFLLGQILDLKVEQLMTSPVEYVDENTPLRETILQLLSKKISSILLVDDNEDAVGIITTDDLLWYLAELMVKESKDNQSSLNVSNIQTIGQIAQTLSQAGV